MPEQLVESINDTARMARTMLSLLLVAALVVVLILSFSSDENLFRDVSVELPQVGIGISIQQSYIVAPLIFLYLHLQVLYLLSVLARKMRELKEGSQEEHFNRLSAFVFIQLFRSQHIPLFPWFLFWFGVVVIPLVLLFAMDLSFVRYQSRGITIGHHIIFIIDLVFIMWSVWIVWPSPGVSEPREITSKVCRMIGISVGAIVVMSFVLYIFVDITLEYRVILDSIFLGGATILFLVGIITVCALLFIVKARLGCVGQPGIAGSICRLTEKIFVVLSKISRVRCHNKPEEIMMVDGMIVSTMAASVLMMLFLFHSVKPPHFDTETFEKDRGCIWKHNKDKNGSCSNYIDRFLCKSLDICRYLDLRYKWLTSTQTIDLTGIVTNESGDESAGYGRYRSVNDLHVVDRNFRFAVFHRAALHGADFRKAKLEGADFTLAKLHGAQFPEAQLRNTTFKRSESKDAIFRGSESQSADFSYSALQGASFEEAQLQGSNFRDAKLAGAFFEDAELQGANFENARLQVADFENAELQGAIFEGAKLDGAVLHKAKLQGANFSRARLEGVDLGEAQLQGSFYEKEFGSWKLAWMPDVSFTFCCAEQYNDMIKKILEENSIVKLAWKEEEKRRKDVYWDKDKGRCEEKEGDVQDTSSEDHLSLEDHLCGYLMPSTASSDRTKLGCDKPPLKEKRKRPTIICYESDAAPAHPSGDRHWTEELAVWASKLACKDSYTAERIFSRWRRIDILSNSHEILSDNDKLRKMGRNILDCKREKGNRTCPGLNTIPDDRWGRLWTDFDDDLPESSCTKPGSSLVFLISGSPAR